MEGTEMDGIFFEIVYVTEHSTTVKFMWKDLGKLFNMSPLDASIKVGRLFLDLDMPVLDDYAEESMLVTDDNYHKILFPLHKLVAEHRAEKEASEK